MQPLHALKTPFYVSYLTIVNTGTSTSIGTTTLQERTRPQPSFAREGAHEPSRGAAGCGLRAVAVAKEPTVRSYALLQHW